MRKDFHNFIYPRPPNVNGQPIVALADDLKDLEKLRPATFEAWLEVNPDDAALALEYVRDKSIPKHSLVQTLRRNGVPITAQTIEGYRA